MTRKGKIARLPHPIREEINRRLQNGEEGKVIIQWLNALPEAIALMAADFEGQPINEPNLSHWKQGGYRDWEAAQPSVHAIQSVAERADAIKENAPEGMIEQMTLVVSGLMARQLINSEASGNAEKEFAALGEWLMRLCRMRRGEFTAQRLAIERERLELLRQKTRQEFEDQCWKWAAQEHVRVEICRGFCFTEREKMRRGRKILEMPPPKEKAPSTQPSPPDPANPAATADSDKA